MASAALFNPLTIRGTTFRNRIWVAPLCQYSIEKKNGVPEDWHLVHLGSMAAGGAGLVMAEASAVSPEGRISDEDTGIWNDRQADAWARVTEFIHSQGAKAGIQLAHAGRKASVWPEWGYNHKGTMAAEDGGWQTVSASTIPFPGYDPPVALDVAAVHDVGVKQLSLHVVLAQGAAVLLRTRHRVDHEQHVLALHRPPPSGLPPSLPCSGSD